MIQLGIILGAIGSVIAYIYHLVTENRNLKQKAASDAAQAKIKEFNDQIAQLDGKVAEDERDYENAKENIGIHPGAKPIPKSNQS